MASSATARGPDSGPLMRGFDHCAPEIGPDGTPYDYYLRVRDEALAAGRMVGWAETHGGFWTVFGYEEFNELARMPEYFSNKEPTFPPYPVKEPFMIVSYDDPDHRLQRGLVNRPFNPVGVKMYEAQIRENVPLLIDGFIADGQADLAKIIAKPIPALVTAIIMGLPAEEGPKFARWVAALAEAQSMTPEESEANINEMYGYFDETIARYQTSPGDDVLSHVVNSEFEGRRFTHDELRGYCTLLMVGGIDNTARLLSAILWRLGWDKPLRDRLRAEPALIPAAVKEFLRYYSPACVGRAVVRDIEFHGCQMKAGDLLQSVLPIANRDPRTFPDPDTFRLDRKPNLHLGLGVGTHRCLGAALITLEAEVLLEEFLKRMPDYEIAEGADIHWVPGPIAGISSVPVRFTPGRPQNIAGGAQKRAVDAWLESARA